MTINVLSLFDGCAGARVALDRLGIECTYYASEIDKYAIKIAQKNYPSIIQLGDIRTLNPYVLPKIDLLIGGSPCQDLSVAGRGKGLAGSRSGLFFDYVRLLRYLNPRYFLLENVRMSKLNRFIISSFLGVGPIEIDSALVSAQSRKRLYWTNIPGVVQPEDREIHWCDVQEHDASCFYYTEDSFTWLFKSDRRSNKYKEYTHATKEKMQMLEASHCKGYSNQRCFGVKDIRGVRYISPVECERLQTLPDNYTEGVSNTQRYKMLGNGFTVDVIAHVLSFADFS